MNVRRLCAVSAQLPQILRACWSRRARTLLPSGLYMKLRVRSVPRYLLFTVVLALPLVLLISSLRTFRELEEQRSVYLRTRVAAVAGRLEVVAIQAVEPEALFAKLAEYELALFDLQVIARDQPSA